MLRFDCTTYELTYMITTSCTASFPGDGLTWGLFKGSVIEEYLTESQEEKHRQLLEKAERHDPVAGITDEIRDRVINHDHALIGWKTALQLEMKQQYWIKKPDEAIDDKCDFAIGIDEFFMERVALAFTMGNPWVEKFNDMCVMGEIDVPSKF